MLKKKTVLFNDSCYVCIGKQIDVVAGVGPCGWRDSSKKNESGGGYMRGTVTISKMLVYDYIFVNTAQLH